MRVSSLAIAAALAAVCLSVSLSSQPVRQPPVDARSMTLLQQGRAARAAGNLDGATDLLETAVLADPRNRAAFLELAGVAEARGLPGKAIRLYREALLLEPNDLAALRGQGEALVMKGALNQARVNLDRIKTLCRGQCGDATLLAAAIAKGPPITTAQVDKPATTPKE